MGKLKQVLKTFPTSSLNFIQFSSKKRWASQFIEWDLDANKITPHDQGQYFRDANKVFGKFSKKSSTLNEAGLGNVFYDNIFQYIMGIVILSHTVTYFIL